MSKTHKDRPEKYNIKKVKPKEGKRFVPTKGRKSINLKSLIQKGYEVE